MIVGIVGTFGPFPRLVEALSVWKRAHPASDVWVQHFAGDRPLEGGLDGVHIEPREAVLERMRRAEAIVCHAGSGTLLDALGCGHVPVVMARRAALQEHVNDHQLEIVAELARAGRIEPIESPEAILEALPRAIARRGDGATARGHELIEALRGELERLGRARRAPPRWMRFCEWLPVRAYRS